MRRQTVLMLAALAALTACARHDAPEGAADSAIAAATTAPPVAKNPHVRAFEIGRAIDTTTKLILGGVATTYQPGDTIFVSIRTEFVPVGSDLGVRLMRGTTTLDSIGLKSGTPDANNLAVISTRLAPRNKLWAPGSYRLEVFLGGVSQGIKDFEVKK